MSAPAGVVRSIGPSLWWVFINRCSCGALGTLKYLFSLDNLISDRAGNRRYLLILV